MSKLYAAFGEFEIPIHIGTATCGWIPPVHRVRFKTEPLLGNVALLKNDETLLAMVSLDTLGLEIDDAEDFRNAVAEVAGTDYASVSISCTHNHSGPATQCSIDGPKDIQLIAEIRYRLLVTVKALLPKLEPAVMGCGFTYENDISWNRRYILKQGHVWSSPQIDKMDVICAEGPIDPQVGVVCVRDMDGLAMGYLVNFACHPLFYGGQCIASPNYPGWLRKELKRLERPQCVCLFLNGAAGDISHANPFDANRTTAESVGVQLAKRSYEVAIRVPYTDDVKLGGKAAYVAINRRHVDDIHLERAKRVLAGETDLVINPIWHPVSTMLNEEFARRLVELRRCADAEPTFPVPIHALRVGETVWAFCPGELYVKFGMQIKVRSKERLTFVASYSNGMVGYIFTPEAQQNGGYEPTPVSNDAIDCSAGTTFVNGLCELLEQL